MSGSAIATRSVGPLDSLPIRPRQIAILFIALLLSTLDGYDALSMAFAAPSVLLEWGIGKDILGLLLASSLVGMGFGAILISPIADILGRKRTVLIALAFLTIGCLLSGAANSVPLLLTGRVVTGIGIGSMISMTTLLSAEFSNVKFRSLIIAGVATIGMPLGGIIGGFGSAALLSTVGWTWIFYSGAIAGILLFLLVAFVLPETPSFLITKQGPKALEQLNRLMVTLGHQPLQELPTAPERKGASFMAIFGSGKSLLVGRLILINSLVAASAYYMINWLPQLVTDAGFAPGTGNRVSAITSLIGLVGGVGLGALASRFTPSRLAVIAMFGLVVGLAALGLTPPVLVGFIAAGAWFSLCLSGTTGLFYGILSDSFPPNMRASGLGVVMGVGRFASASGPALAGWLFATGFSRADVSLAFAMAPALAALLLVGMPIRRSGVQVDRYHDASDEQ